jgi:hypothetical protein
MVITRTLSIAESVNKLERAANRLLTAAQDFDNLRGSDAGLPQLVKLLNLAVRDADDARDDIEAAVDEYLNEGDDEYTDDEEDEDAEYEMYGADDFPLYMEYDDDFRNTDSPYE